MDIGNQQPGWYKACFRAQYEDFNFFSRLCLEKKGKEVENSEHSMRGI